MAFTITKPIAEHKAEVVKKIETLRETKTNSPITYLGLTWDADTISRENINGKIVEISSKQLLGITDTNLFWKDTANTIHTWSTMDEYLLWLRGLAIAIAERGTLLYATAWSKKAEAEALTTVTAVVTYDVNSGW